MRGTGREPLRDRVEQSVRKSARRSRDPPRAHDDTRLAAPGDTSSTAHIACVNREHRGATFHDDVLFIVYWNNDADHVLVGVVSMASR